MALTENSWRKLLEPQWLVTTIITTVLSISALLVALNANAQVVNITDAGSKAILNEDFNPFLGVWRPTPSGDRNLGDYPQIVIKKDDFGRLWLDLYQHCTDANCRLGQFPAEIKDDTISTKGGFVNWSFVLTAKIQNGSLVTDIKAVPLNGYTGVVASSYSWYERVPQNDTAA